MTRPIYLFPPDLLERCRTFVDHAEQSLVEGNYDSILSEYEGLRLGPDVFSPLKIIARVYVLLGKAHEKQLRYHNAVTAFQTAVGLQPANEWFQISLANALVHDGRELEAERLFLVLVALYPSKPHVARNYLKFMRQTNRFENFDIVVGSIEREGLDDKHTWLELARCLRKMDQVEEAIRFYDKAIVHAATSAERNDIEIEKGELSYDHRVYWDQRYQSSQGERTPVPRSLQSDDKYLSRQADEASFIRNLIAKFVPDQVDRALEAGCGSGRLSFVYAEVCHQLTCVDISHKAMEYCKKNTTNLPVDQYVVAPLETIDLPSDSYDFVFDNVCIQHVVEEDSWLQILAQYYRLTRRGGHVFLIEVAGERVRPGTLHVSRKSVTDYVATLEELGSKVLETGMMNDNHFYLVAKNGESA